MKSKCSILREQQSPDQESVVAEDDKERQRQA